MQEFYYTYIPETDSFALDGYKGDEAGVVIPSTQANKPVTMVFDNAFRGHTEIVSVKFPDDVHFIGSYVFDGCTNLRSVELPANLETLYQYAFARCGIEEIVLPEKTRYLPFGAFKDCKNLRKVVCNDALAEISAHAFDGCNQLTEVVNSPDDTSPLSARIVTSI